MPLTFVGVIGEITQLYVTPEPGTVPVFVKFTWVPIQAEEYVNVAETGLVPVILATWVEIQPIPSVTVMV